MASSSSSEGRSPPPGAGPPSPGEEYTPSVQRGEGTATESTVGGQSPTGIGAVMAGFEDPGHHTVAIGGESSRTTEVEARAAESSGREPHATVPSGDVAMAGETHGPVEDDSNTSVVGEIPVSNGVANQPRGERQCYHARW